MPGTNLNLQNLAETLANQNNMLAENARRDRNNREHHCQNVLESVEQNNAYMRAKADAVVRHNDQASQKMYEAVDRVEEADDQNTLLLIQAMSRMCAAPLDAESRMQSLAILDLAETTGKTSQALVAKSIARYKVKTEAIAGELLLLNSKQNLENSAINNQVELLKQLFEMSSAATKAECGLSKEAVQRAVEVAKFLQEMELNERKALREDSEHENRMELNLMKQNLERWTREHTMRLEEQKESNSFALRREEARDWAELRSFQEENGHERETARQKAELGFEEIERYMKHKLTGKGTWYEFTRNEKSPR